MSVGHNAFPVFALVMCDKMVLQSLAATSSQFLAFRLSISWAAVCIGSF